MLDDILIKLRRRKIEDGGPDSKLEEEGSRSKASKEEEAPPAVSTQTVLPSAEERLKWKREEYIGKECITISGVKETQALKIKGFIFGYVKQVMQESSCEHILLSDETDEIFCAVHQEVFEQYSFEKNAVVVLDSPSVWRHLHTKTSPMLNITPKNIVSISCAPFL